jgi:hypothetical protein
VPLRPAILPALHPATGPAIHAALHPALRPALRLALLAAAFLGAVPGPAAGDVTREQGLATVMNAFVIGHPEEFFLEVYSPLAPLPPGTAVRARFPTDPVRATTTTDTWFYWVNYFPRARFAHDTKLVGVRKDDGTIAFAVDSSFWPVLGGVVRYRSYADRKFGGERIHPPPGPKPEPVAQPSGGGDPEPPPVPEPRLLRPAGFAPAPAPPAPGKVCAVVISGEDTTGAGNPWKVDFLRSRAAHDTTNANGPRMHPDSIRTAVQPSLMDVCDLIESIPEGYDKLYFFFTGHGDSLTGDIILSDYVLPPMDLMCKLKDRAPKNVCIVIDACLSGVYVEPMCRKGLCGTIFTAANATENAWEYTENVAGTLGSVFNDAWNQCIRLPHSSPAEVYACAVARVKQYCATLPPQDAKTRAGGQHPQFSSMYEFTESGQEMAFADVPGCTTMCFQFYPVPGNPANTSGNATLYCEKVDNTWGTETVFECVRRWNWNPGQTRYYNPNHAVATGEYHLVAHSNHYPVRVGVSWPANAVPDTPPPGPEMADQGVGWANVSAAEFNPGLGVGSGGTPGYAYVEPEGWNLCLVPENMGTEDTNPMTFEFPLVADPTRPFLYVNGDPGQGLNGDLVVTVGATEVFPGEFPLALSLTQPGGNSYLTSANFGASPPGGYRAQFVIPAGNVDVQNMIFTFTVPNIGERPRTSGAPLVPAGFRLDFLTIDLLLDPVTGVPDPEGSPRRPVVLGTYPNPFAGTSRIGFELPRMLAVTLRIFDVRGRRIRDLLVERRLVGRQEVPWDGRDDRGVAVPGGVYFYRLETEGLTESRKIVLRR